MSADQLILMFFITKRRGIRLWRVSRPFGKKGPLVTLYEWEHRLLADDAEARFFSY